MLAWLRAPVVNRRLPLGYELKPQTRLDVLLRLLVSLVLAVAMMATLIVLFVWSIVRNF